MRNHEPDPDYNPNLPQHRPMKCDLCGGAKISTEEDVGWDIDEDGEERQHLDTCSACGANRMWCDRYDHKKGSFVTWGVWSPKGKHPHYWDF